MHKASQQRRAMCQRGFETLRFQARQPTVGWQRRHAEKRGLKRVLRRLQKYSCKLWIPEFYCERKNLLDTLWSEGRDERGDRGGTIIIKRGLTVPPSVTGNKNINNSALSCDRAYAMWSCRTCVTSNYFFMRYYIKWIMIDRYCIFLLII